MISCKETVSVIPQVDQAIFNTYWNQGKAEISSYVLSQARYSEMHDGKIVMIFVTEDFSKSKLVKLDKPSMAQQDAIRVLKLNTMREFVTGIYKYSMMSSVFTPVDYEEYPHSLKLTSSTQEWCGQTFMQAENKKNRFEFREFSYFESVGDKSNDIMMAWLEDEIWTRIRLAPNTLPIGEIKMIPGAAYIRLSHIENSMYEADATLTITNDSMYQYSVTYPELERTLTIDFEKAFPFKIIHWIEIAGQEMTTAVMDTTVITDYWNQNKTEFEICRKDLNLE
jgi:hypothetical protein